MTEGIIGKFATWAIIILFMFVFLFVFYSPEEGFMGKMANLVLGANRFLPVVPQKELKQDELLPKLVVTTETNLVQDISSQPDSEKCLLKLRDLSNLGDLKIKLSNYRGVTARVKNPVGKELNPIKTSNDKTEVCIINPDAFWKCYFNPSNTDCTQQLYTKIDSAEITKDSIIVNGKSYSLAQGFLFKPDKDRVCFIPAQQNYDVTSNCDETTTLLDTDCLVKFNRIPQCGVAELTDAQLCQIMYGCFGENKVDRIPLALYCKEGNPVTRARTQSDCEKVKQCSDKKINRGGTCAQDTNTPYYLLSYSQLYQE